MAQGEKIKTAPCHLLPYGMCLAPRDRIPKDATIKERMKRKLRTRKGRMTYVKRKQIIETVSGQTKEIRGFRRFSLRGLDKVSAEWHFICLTHIFLKLFGSAKGYLTSYQR